jgi:tetratricopeptide (TPR) repeat protein
VHWVDGTSPETMEASISAIASADDGARAGGVEVNSASVLPWLASREQNWLMIFDGADGGYEEVEAFIPAGKCGNILISTRNSDMQRLASSVDASINVIELDQDAAVALFTKSARLNSSILSQQAHIETIVRELCCLPLAVDQAAASIASGLCCVDEYLDTYKRHRLGLMDNLTFKGSSNYGRAVYATWDISFIELERRASTQTSDSISYEVAIFLLKLFSFFHFDGIHEDTFRRAAETQGRWLPPLPSNSELLLILQQTEDNDWDFFNFRKAIHVLSMFSLVHSAGSCTYSMHRLVHQWMQDRLPKSHRSAIGLLAADVLARSEDFGASSDDHAYRRALLVHLITLTGHLKENDLMHQLSADTLWRMGWTYNGGGKPDDAEALLRRAVSLVNEDNSKPTEQHMTMMGDLASALYASENLKEAEVLDRRVLRWREQHLGTDHRLTARTRGFLALTLYRQGRHWAAKRLLLQVLEWQKGYLSTDDPNIYSTMGNLAVTHYELGELAEARGLQVQALEWQKIHLGMDHPETYWSMCSLAITLFALRELDEARGLEEQVLKWRKAHLGMDHPTTYWTMASLAVTLRVLGELGEAKALEVQVLKWRKEHFGLKHKETIYAMEDLASTLKKLGENAEAEELKAQATELQGPSDTSS